MEEYKQHLCSTFNIDCKSEDTIYEHIKSNPQYRYRLNEEGRLHSNYTGSYYKPAIIRIVGNIIDLYWLFDGKIKDCSHPFSIGISYGEIYDIQYYSSERIQEGQPISISYSRKKIRTKTYNQYCCYLSGKYFKILDDFDNSHHIVQCVEYLDRHLFTSGYCPLCDPIDSYKFKLKFAD